MTPDVMDAARKYERELRRAQYGKARDRLVSSLEDARRELSLIQRLPLVDTGRSSVPEERAERVQQMRAVAAGAVASRELDLEMFDLEHPEVSE